MHPELLRKQGKWFGFYNTNKAVLNWFSHSRLSSASRNCFGVHGPSDARQFHMNNCCLTAGFRALLGARASAGATEQRSAIHEGRPCHTTGAEIRKYTHNHDLHCGIEWPTKDLQVVLKLRKRQAV